MFDTFWGESSSYPRLYSPIWNPSSRLNPGRPNTQNTKILFFWLHLAIQSIYCVSSCTPWTLAVRGRAERERRCRQCWGVGVRFLAGAKMSKAERMARHADKLGSKARHGSKCSCAGLPEWHILDNFGFFRVICGWGEVGFGWEWGWDMGYATGMSSCGLLGTVFHSFLWVGPGLVITLLKALGTNPLFVIIYLRPRIWANHLAFWKWKRNNKKKIRRTFKVLGHMFEVGF